MLVFERRRAASGSSLPTQSIDNAPVRDCREPRPKGAPHPSVYRLPAERFNLATEAMCFLSANAWDAHAAKAFGYRVLWCNRFAQASERIPEPPDGVIETLAALPEIVV